MSAGTEGFPEPDGDVRASLGAALADPYAPDSVHTVAERVHELKPGVSVLHASWAVVALRAMGWKPPEETAVAPRHRPGDQPPPVPNDGPSMHDLVCDDLASWPAAPSDIKAACAGLQERKRIGLERYGSLLQAHNSRDAWRDLTEELEDAVVYAKQVIVEHPARPPADLEMAYDAILSTLLRVRRLRDEEAGS